MAREEWTDDQYGISLDRTAAGRVRFRWLVDQDLSVALLGLSQVRGLLDVLEREYVFGLRQGGDSWDDIGWLLGITGEAARRRHAAAELEYLRSLGEGSEDV